MNEQKRVKVMLAVVGILVLGNLYVHFGGGASEIGVFSGGPSLVNAADRSRAEKSMEIIKRLPELNFAPKEAGVGEGEDAERNPFLFGGPDPRVVAEHQRRQAELEEARVAAVVEAQAQAAAEEETEAAAPPKPTFPGKVLGVLASHDDGLIQFAVQLNEELLVVGLGETFDQQYQLMDFQYPTVQLVFTRQNERIEINLESE
ncbi:hypothetical protein [Acanthopleuribacter pedis]|uniref:Uncharacterized protein n=1 Tax=Acanthopleuribacter pedis TaxID=442870 RepID=A0A8J7QGH0_9BACT|nr:hypothetical protein [Acanthopleuribacter pedis]MBO1318115.1 hypothetical protein [Acanthopleuribacter pedis]